MKKKLVMIAVALMVAFAALPCFAEIRVDRGGYSENGFSVYVAKYWNDKSSNFPEISANEDAKKTYEKYSERLRRNDWRSFTKHLYFSYNEIYFVVIFCGYADNLVCVQCSYGNGYRENIYENNFFNYNDAKAEFDSLCQQYYNKIAR